MKLLSPKKNTDSISVVKNAGYVKYTKGGALDTKMIVGENFKIKELWIKDISSDKGPEFFILSEENKSEICKSNLPFRIWEEEESKDSDSNILSPFQQKRQTGRYHFFFQSNVTEKAVGISNNEF